MKVSHSESRATSYLVTGRVGHDESWVVPQQRQDLRDEARDLSSRTHLIRIRVHVMLPVPRRRYLLGGGMSLEK